jgi:hypothetical protein
MRDQYTSAPPQLSGNQPVGPFQKLWYQLGSVIAGLATILLVPQLWDLTHSWVFDYAAEAYGSRDIAHLVHLAWGGLLAAACFLILRAIAVLTLVVLAEQFLYRLVF